MLTSPGGPGVGKDTQCAKLAKAFDFCHISTGDLLRKEIERIGSLYSHFIQKSIDIGFTVPAELMISLLTAVAKGFKWFVNGFPRSFDQLVTFEQRVIFVIFNDDFLLTLLRSLGAIQLSPWIVQKMCRRTYSREY